MHSALSAAYVPVVAAAAAGVTAQTLPDLVPLAPFFDRWGVPMVLVAVILLANILAQARREKRDAAREERLMAGFERQEAALQELRDAVTQQTAVLLATSDAPEERVNTLAARLACRHGQEPRS